MDTQLKPLVKCFSTIPTALAHAVNDHARPLQVFGLWSADPVITEEDHYTEMATACEEGHLAQYNGGKGA